jgi:hypothetical protein
MKIRYREAGGFAGISRGVDVDTAILPDDEARHVVALVEAAGLKSGEQEGPPEARDLLGYRIVVEHDEERIVVSFDDATIPEAVDELLAWLEERIVVSFDDATIPEAVDELLAWLQDRARPQPLK